MNNNLELISPITISLDDLKLPTRIRHSLGRCGVSSLQDLLDLFANKKIYEIKNIGELSIDIINKSIEEFLISNNARFPNKKNGEEKEGTEKLPRKILDQILFDLPIYLIADFTKNNELLSIISKNIRTFGELGKVSTFYENLVNSEEQLINMLILILEKKVKDLINSGKLNPNVKIKNQKIKNIIEFNPENNYKKITKISFLKIVLLKDCLNNELNDLFGGIDERRRVIFLKYYLEKNTLESISKDFNVTRERIRQILQKINRDFRREINKNPYIYIQMGLIVANDLGSELSKDIWKSELIKLKILSDEIIFNDFDAFDVYCSILLNKEISSGIIKSTDNISIILNSPSDFSLNLIKLLDIVTNEHRKEIKKIVGFTGGIHITQAAKIINQPIKATKNILHNLGLKEIISDWYAFYNHNDLGQKSPITNAGLLMIKICGILKLEIFLDGLRRYISRHYESIAPIEVIKFTLLLLGFSIDDNDNVAWDKEINIELSNSEKCLIILLSEKGPIVSFQEIVAYYLDNNFSRPTATSQIMARSPIIERIDTGYYKIRGFKHTWENLNSVMERQQKYAKDAEVIYGVDGLVRYRINLDSWGSGGVINIKLSDLPLPNFDEGWRVYVNGENVGKAKRDEFLIWGLSPALAALNAHIGDRLELEFNSWNEPFINARIINE